MESLSLNLRSILRLTINKEYLSKLDIVISKHLTICTMILVSPIFLPRILPQFTSNIIRITILLLRCIHLPQCTTNISKVTSSNQPSSLKLPTTNSSKVSINRTNSSMRHPRHLPTDKQEAISLHISSLLK